ncbi:MAG: hypothetical protein ACOC3X_03340 [Nanoarchaeota archaeon]
MKKDNYYFKNNHIENVVLNSKNINILEEEIIKTIDDLFIVENEFEKKKLSYTKKFKKPINLFKTLKKEVDDYFDVDKISMPICYTPSFFNEIKSKSADISNSFLSLIFCSGVFASFFEPSLYNAGVIGSSALLSYKVFPYSFYKKTNSRNRFFSVININSDNHESMKTTFIHEYVHDIQRKKGLNKQNLKNHSFKSFIKPNYEHSYFMEGHARFVQCDFAKKYAKHEKNDLYLIYPYVDKGRDLLMAYSVLCDYFNKPIKEDLFIFDLDYNENLKSNSNYKKKVGFFEPHAFGTAYFSIMQKKSPDNFYENFVKIF